MLVINLILKIINKRQKYEDDLIDLKEKYFIIKRVDYKDNNLSINNYSIFFYFNILP